jgi:hypothetical protein
MTDFHHRARLLDPLHVPSHKVRVTQQVTRFASDLVLEDSRGVRLTRKVEIPTRMRRLIIRTTTVYPWWISVIMRLFSWIVLPWAERDWGDGHWRFTPLNPTYRLSLWWDRKYQAHALDRLYVQDVGIVGPNQTWGSTFVEPVAAAMFSELAIAMRLEMPTASPGQEIVVELCGTGGPITVDIVSDIILPEVDLGQQSS